MTQGGNFLAGTGEGQGAYFSLGPDNAQSSSPRQAPLTVSLLNALVAVADFLPDGRPPLTR